MDEKTADTIGSRLVEALLEDERLRGDLADDAYRPLLTWAKAAARRCAARAAAEAHPDRVAEACLGQLRALLWAAAAVVAGAAPDGLAALVAPPVFTKGTVRTVKASVLALRPGGDEAGRAAAVVRALSTSGTTRRKAVEAQRPSTGASSDSSGAGSR